VRGALAKRCKPSRPAALCAMITEEEPTLKSCARRVLLFVPLILSGQIALSGQTLRDPALLRNWPAPLYWQPSRAENAIKPEVKSAASAPAQTPANSLVFVAMTPCRVADTRAGFGFTGSFGPPSLAAGATRSFPIQASTTCTIPSIALAYSFNLTVVTSSFLNYLTVWPFGSTQPNASTLNDDLGTVVANAAIIPAGNDSSGSINVFASNNTDFIIDINGYYAAQTGITLTQGTVGAPSLSFSGDSGTGIYSTEPGSLSIATGGTTAFTVDPTGDLNIFGSIRRNSGTLFLHSIGSQNLGVGLEALSSNSGANNTATGYQALYANTSASYNTAVGAQALVATTTAGYNTAVGAQALFNNNTGIGNTAIGTSALENNTSGDYNIALGFAAASNVSGGNGHNIHIGNTGSSADNAAIRIGNVGTQTSFFAAGIYGSAASSGVPVYINSSGQLGTTTSSRRYKDDIQDMGDASSGLLTLRPVTFRYKQPYSDGSKPIDYGLIAEEVAEVYPDLVVKNADGQIETVQYQKLTPMLLNELQKQALAIRDLQAEVAALKAERSNH